MSFPPCIAKSDYSAVDPDELSITGGETIEVLDKDEDGWWYCRRKSDNATGFVPYTYLSVLETPREEGLSRIQALKASLQRSQNVTTTPKSPADDIDDLGVFARKIEFEITANATTARPQSMFGGEEPQAAESQSQARPISMVSQRISTDLSGSDTSVDQSRRDIDPDYDSLTLSSKEGLSSASDSKSEALYDLSTPAHLEDDIVVQIAFSKLERGIIDQEEYEHIVFMQRQLIMAAESSTDDFSVSTSPLRQDLTNKPTESLEEEPSTGYLAKYRIAQCTPDRVSTYEGTRINDTEADSPRSAIASTPLESEPPTSSGKESTTRARYENAALHSKIALLEKQLEETNAKNGEQQSAFDRKLKLVKHELEEAKSEASKAAQNHKQNMDVCRREAEKLIQSATVKHVHEIADLEQEYEEQKRIAVAEARTEAEAHDTSSNAKIIDQLRKENDRLRSSLGGAETQASKYKFMLDKVKSDLANEMKHSDETLATLDNLRTEHEALVEDNKRFKALENENLALVDAVRQHDAKEARSIQQHNRELQLMQSKYALEINDLRKVITSLSRTEAITPSPKKTTRAIVTLDDADLDEVSRSAPTLNHVKRAGPPNTRRPSVRANYKDVVQMRENGQSPDLFSTDPTDIGRQRTLTLSQKSSSTPTAHVTVRASAATVHSTPVQQTPQKARKKRRALPAPPKQSILLGKSKEIQL